VHFVETPVFTRQVEDLLGDAEYRALQLALFLRPEQGSLVPGTGGLRKLRWKTSGQGKRGGLRVIYYWDVKRSVIYMLLAYPKNRQEDLTPEQKRILTQLVREELK
jgi:mRNA-degrading endonuclease RelE of RelBE toxin-antitoxin system